MKTLLLTAATLMFALTALSPTAMGGDKKTQKKSFFCKVPFFKKTALCPAYSKQQEQKLAPRVPTIHR
jgi:hypothetical protein